MSKTNASQIIEPPNESTTSHIYTSDIDDVQTALAQTDDLQSSIPTNMLQTFNASQVHNVQTLIASQVHDLPTLSASSSSKENLYSEDKENSSQG